MAFNFLQSLMALTQNTDDEGTPVDEFDDNADESDTCIKLNLNEEEEVDGDIDSSDPLLRVPQVADAMSRKRYTDIGKYLHIKDNASVVAAGQDGYDPLFKIRPVIKCVKQACNTLFRPGASISLMKL
ncbi:PiggyBac transposable element-derived protein 3 [Plakobranchus ocellatus]|uniref:PiggyBac transposable element-derived protein 3 n=1 Tax=Plakobranchus ocellatus TaxID=259542 RepID=A0AAV4B2E9_9GAST|nr:PiggyBac transposable element-derived protein 3 [Plakobranchus ocellatus]